MPVQPEPGCADVEIGDITVDGIGCCSPSIVAATLCTPDGPIAVLVASPCGDCDTDTGDPQTVGWVDLTTGEFTPGSPPPDAGPCTAEPCTPEPLCPGLVGLAGPETWTSPEGTESVTVSVVCPPVQIATCAGPPVTVNECGASFSWGGVGTNCEPGVICPITIDVPDGSAAYVTFAVTGGCEEGAVP